MKNFSRIFEVQIKEFNLKQMLLAFLLAFFSLLASPVFMESKRPLSTLFFRSISGPAIREIRLIEIFQIIALWTVIILNIMKKLELYEQMKELIVLRFKSIYKWLMVEAISFMVYELLFLILYVLSVFLLGLFFCQGNWDLLPTGMSALKAFLVYFLDSLLLVLMIFATLLLSHSTQQTVAVIFMILCFNAFCFLFLENQTIFFRGRHFMLEECFSFLVSNGSYCWQLFWVK